MHRCIIAEDEELLREALRSLLAKAWPDLEIVALCEDGGAALEGTTPGRCAVVPSRSVRTSHTTDGGVRT